MKETLIESEQHSEQQQQPSPLEELINKVNGQGKYQKQSFLIFCAMWFLTACLLLGMNFFFDDSFTCKDPVYANKDDCREYICSLPNWARSDEIGEHAPSILFEFQTYLICPDHKTIVSVLQDMMFLGSLVGFFVIPFIADNFGARLALKIAWGIATVAILLVALSTQISMLGIGLFFIGFGANPSITLCFSFINQICLGKSRQNYSIGVQIAWALGQITVALAFLTGISWKGVMFVLLGLFLLCSLSVQFLLQQSLMFLLKKYPEKALVAFNKIARLNKRQQLTQTDIDTVHQEEMNTDLHPQQKSLGVTDLFKYKSIRMTSIASAMIFFGIQVIYYSSSLSEGTIGFSKTLNQCLFATSQMAGYIVSQYVVHKVPRKKATFFGMGIASLLCLVLGVMVFFQTDDNKNIMKWFQIIVLMLTSFVLCCFYSIAFVYTAELYPTQIRSIGFGWVSLVGILGSIVSPFAGTIASSISLNSWFVSAILGSVAWGFGFFLPETFGKPLKDTIQERLSHLIDEKSRLDQEYSDDEQYDDFDPIPQIKSSKSVGSSSPRNSPPHQSQSIDKKSVSCAYIIQNYD